LSIRIIQPPETVLVKLDDGKEEEFPFSRFIQAMLNMPEWGKDWRTVQAAIEIDKACTAANGGAFELSDRPYDLLRSVAENPSQGYLIHPLILRHVSTYFEAIFDAKKKGSE